MVLGNASRDEQAVPVDLGIEWDIGAPQPVLMQSDSRTFLAVYLATYGGKVEDRVAVIEWHRCYGAVLRGLNDEAFHGHYLWDRGLGDIWASRQAAEVRNSAWLTEEERANSVHRSHDPASFARLKHFILPLKDSTFECQAASYTIDIYNKAMEEVVADLIPKLTR